jgi:hypothetical protein
MKPAAETYDCLRENADLCHWGNTWNGVEDGGWSKLYTTCKLWNIDT